MRFKVGNTMAIYLLPATSGTSRVLKEWVDIAKLVTISCESLKF